MKRIVLSLLVAAASSFGAEFPVTPGHHTMQFAESAVQSGGEEVKARLSAEETAPPYDVAKERFELIVPAGYHPGEAYGLFIWIDAGPAPKIPAVWEAVLARHKLLFLAAHNSGNPRNIFDRIRLAVDGNVAMRRRYKIDGARVYVSGFSAGARVASMLGVAFADLFTGMAPFMGVNFYTDLTGPDGQRFGTSYLPDEEVLAIAKAKCRHVLITGEKDFNRSNTRAAYDGGFRKEGFQSVLYLEVPAIGHGLPDAKYLDRALTFLDTEKE